MERDPKGLSDDDVAFWSYVKPDQRPATVAGDGENNYDDEEGEESEGEWYIDEDIMDIDLNDGCNSCMLCNIKFYCRHFKIKLC